MDPSLYAETKRILLEALALPADERVAWVESTCADRPDLCAEVLDLLGREQSVAPMVDEPVVKLPGGMPEQIGKYAIVDIIGEGGMGVVYRARQSVPIEREVAIKVLHAGLDTARVLERFAWERRSLARMDHPHIARILDAGEDEGRPFVVLELVDGVPLTTWTRDQGVPLAERLRLVERVCQAVQHAHDRGILHRDLKPGNVLVREVDGEAVPAIIDFGIAKALDETLADRPELTMDGQRVGTPAYMSPEQEAGGSVDIRTDVFALGVMLYEVLAGRRPWNDADLRPGAARPDAPPPSRVVGQRELRGDLDHICLQALHPDPSRRYRSAVDLADDLRRFREGRPVTATPDSFGYRAGKAARRNPAAATGAVAFMIMAVLGVAFLVYHAQRLDTERLRAVAAEAQARREADAASDIAGFLENLFIELDPVAEGRAPTSAVALLDQGAARLEDDLAGQPANRARLWGVLGRVNQSLARHELAEEQLRRGLAAWAEAPDTNTTVAARSEQMRMLAICLHDLARYADSETAFGHALSLHERAYPVPDLARVQLRTDLATALQAQAKYDRAFAMLAEAAAQAAALGPEGEGEVAYIRNLRGYMLYQRGRYAESLEDMTTALATQRGLIEGDSVDLVASLNNVGGMSLELGRLDAAEAHIVESREISARIYQGEDHPLLMRADLHLGRIALARGDTARAMDLFASCYERFVDLMGMDHPSTRSAQLSYAEALLNRGRTDEARQAYNESLDWWVERRGPDYFRTLVGRRRFGEFLLRTGEPEAAAGQFEAVIASYGTQGVPGHPRADQCRVALAEARLAIGDAQAARALAERALPRLAETFGADGEDAARARAVLARTGR